MNTPLTRAFGDKIQWVNWELRSRDKKATKVPIMPNSGGTLASSTDPRTWDTLRRAQQSSPKIGIVFTPDKTLLGIDIDHCIDEKTGKIVHEKRDEILHFLKSADTYTELSPSRTGIHAFLILSEPVTLEASRHAPYELYTSGRFFTVTGENYGSKVRELRTVSKIELEALLTPIGYPWKEKPAPEPVAPKTLPIPANLDDSAVVHKMLASKNGEKLRKIYDGDVSEYGGDESRADMALISALAFWTQKNAAQMERIWITSPLGKRVKTQRRADYRARTIREALETTTEVYTPSDLYQKQHPGTFDEQFPGTPVPKILDLMVRHDSKGNEITIVNTENITRILRFDDTLSRAFRFNSFTMRVESCLQTRSVLGEWDSLMQEHIIATMLHIQREYAPTFANVKKDAVLDAIKDVAHDVTVNPPGDYFRSLAWDGTPRLDTWLSRAYHTPADAVHAAMGANWLKGLVKRVIEPGCKFDYVLVLEGPQGIGKSQSLIALGAQWHVDLTITPDSKDFFITLQRNMLVEFSEGDTMNRTDTKKMKAVITTQVDDFRRPYGDDNIRFPRHCVFAMTTNSREYLKDESGNRRYLPVRCIGVIDVDWIRVNRDQLFAEAYHRAIVKRETTWEFPKEIEDMQADRMIEDPYQNKIVDWYCGLDTFTINSGITTVDVYKAVHLENVSMGREVSHAQALRISAVLQSILYLERRKTSAHRDRTYAYFPTDKTLEHYFPGTVPSDTQITTF